VQGGGVYNSATGAGAAGARSSTYNPQTGAWAGSRGGVATDGNGNYAAGRQTGGYNPDTGRGVYSSKTVTGNVNNGTADVNRQGVAVNTQNQSAVAWKNGQVYAGHDGNVYKRTDDGWEQNGSNGWQPVQPNFNQSQTYQSLQKDYQGRATGQQRYQSWGGSRPQSGGGAQQPLFGQGGGRFR
jgi:hypothetical protein